MAFSGGFANEAMATFWVHNAELGRVGWTAACSLLQGLAVVVGIGESVRSRRSAAAFVVGYAAGSAFAVWVR